jgi:7-cyano-7-deazaguanine synthase in queuosine biosynthesis
MYTSTLLQGDQTTTNSGLILMPGANLLNGKKEFIEKFGQPSSLEEDLLNLCATIYATDIASKRLERENVSRQFNLTIPVINYQVFQSVAEEIKYALLILSHDHWNINFVPYSGTPEGYRKQDYKTKNSLLLFSGGLDSFSGALELCDQYDNLTLVSHITANPVVKGSQEKLLNYINSKFPGKCERLSFHISGRKSGCFDFPSDSDREESQRTRSFMFLSIAGLVARRKQISEILFIAENGQMAIHLPLTAARISAFSTYTAHPEFLRMMQDILQAILQFPIIIQNPYLYRTKAEVVASTVRNHKDEIHNTVSCWKASRVTSVYNHCGVCIPCLIRRIALEYNNLILPEYETDLFTEDILKLPSDNDGKRNLADLCEFIKMFNQNATQAELEVVYPDLVNPYFNGADVVAMYKRFAEESRVVFQKYPNVMRFLG